MTVEVSYVWRDVELGWVWLCLSGVWRLGGVAVVESGCDCQVYEDLMELQFESGCDCQVYEDLMELQFESGCECQVYEDLMELQFESGCDCQVYEDLMELQFESGCDCQVYEDSVELQLLSLVVTVRCMKTRWSCSLSLVVSVRCMKTRWSCSLSLVVTVRCMKTRWSCSLSLVVTVRCMKTRWSCSLSLVVTVRCMKTRWSCSLSLVVIVRCMKTRWSCSCSSWSSVMSCVAAVKSCSLQRSTTQSSSWPATLMTSDMSRRHVNSRTTMTARDTQQVPPSSRLHQHKWAQPSLSHNRLTVMNMSERPKSLLNELPCAGSVA